MGGIERTTRVDISSRQGVLRTHYNVLSYNKLFQIIITGFWGFGVLGFWGLGFRV